MLLEQLTWNILRQGLQYLFCCHNLFLAWGFPCSQALVEWKTLEVSTAFMSFCLKELNEKANLDHGWSIPVLRKILHSSCGQCIALQTLCRERHLLPSTGDSVCWNSLSMWYLSCLCLRANYKYFLNMRSHPNSFPNERTNHTFGYALSDPEVIQK